MNQDLGDLAIKLYKIEQSIREHESKFQQNFPEIDKALKDRTLTQKVSTFRLVIKELSSIINVAK